MRTKAEQIAAIRADQEFWRALARSTTGSASSTPAALPRVGPVRAWLDGARE